MKSFLNLVYQNGMIPAINKPTRIIRKTPTKVDKTHLWVETLSLAF